MTALIENFRVHGKPVVWYPFPGPQSLALTCPANEILFGGARGGGKTDWGLGDFMAHAKTAGRFARGIWFRRSMPELQDAIDRSREIFGQLGWKYNEAKNLWRAPNGASLRFRFIERETDAEKYQGHSYTWMMLDEAGTWPEYRTVSILRGTLRSRGIGIKTRLCLTANPLGKGHAWLKARYIDNAKPFEMYKDPQTGLYRVFIPARLKDNPVLMQSEDYQQQLMEATVGRPGLRRAWLEGDWNAVEDVPGALWMARELEANRVNTVPDLVTVVVAIDPAVSAKTGSDWTGLAVIGIAENKHRYILHSEQVKARPEVWADKAISLYDTFEANTVIAEVNQGGDLVKRNLEAAGYNGAYKEVHATRGKYIRAEPIAAEFARGLWHFVGAHKDAENELTTWVPGEASPNILDAIVWGGTYFARQPGAGIMEHMRNQLDEARAKTKGDDDGK